MIKYHISVLLQQALEGLQVKKGKKYIDATLGGGGHSEEIIKRGGIVLGIDVDIDAIEYVKKKFRIQNSEFRIGETLTVVQGNFKNINKIAQENGFEKVAGVLFDLGVSSYQLDAGQRGFSFQKEAPLDMRMDSSLTVRAADLVNGLTEAELIELFSKLGEEPFGKRIAKRIVLDRVVKPIETTGELARIAVRSYPKGFHRIHPATKIFQALRMAVNDELGSLCESLPKAFSLLEKNGRLIVISFHSLEDKIVKEYFTTMSEEKKGRIITKKPIVPTEEEVLINKRARSSKLRILEKL